MLKSKYVIIGAGPGGLQACEAIRRADKYGRITILMREQHLPYSPMSLMYIVKGKTAEPGAPMRHKIFFDRLSVELLHDPVASLDPAVRTIVLESGASIEYEKLLIATGARPAATRAKLTGEPPMCSMRAIHDASLFQQFCAVKRSGIIVGAGATALQAAEFMIRKKLETTVIQRGLSAGGAPQILSRQLDKTLAHWVQGIYEAQGARFILGVSLTEVEQLPEGVRVRTDDGKDVVAGFVLQSSGITPNKELAEAAGIACNQGIIVDHEMRTNFPDIYAAGDVAEAPLFHEGGNGLNPTQQSAVFQGDVAGSNMSGQKKSGPGDIRTNLFSFFGHRVYSLGVVDKGDDQLVACDRGAHWYRSLVLDNGKLIGAVGLNDPAHPGLLLQCIRQGLDISSVKKTLGRTKDLGEVLSGVRLSAVVRSRQTSSGPRNASLNSHLANCKSPLAAHEPGSPRGLLGMVRDVVKGFFS